MTFFDSPLDLFHLLLSMLYRVLFDGHLLFLSHSSGPKFHILNLLLFLSLEGFLFPFKKHLIVVHNLIIVELSLALHV